jgi:hypothetical protein
MQVLGFKENFPAFFESSSELFEKYEFPITLLTIILLASWACFGYRIFKFTLTALGALSFGAIGNLVISPFLEDKLTSLAEKINLPIILGLVFAILGAILVNLAEKFAVFAMGGGVGFLLGKLILSKLVTAFQGSEFLGEKYSEVIVPAICALTLALLFTFKFREIYISTSGILGMILLSQIVLDISVPAPTEITQYAFLAFGGVLGVIACAYQFRREERV